MYTNFRLSRVPVPKRSDGKSRKSRDALVPAPVDVGLRRFLARLRIPSGAPRETLPPAEIPETGVIKVLNLHLLAGNPSRTTIIFIHFHPREWFAPGFLKLIESACSSGYRVIVASNARPSKASNLLKLGNLAYVQRVNLGYDFGALRDVRSLLSTHGLLEDGRYVVLNSSLLNIASAGFGSDPVLDRLAQQDQDTDLLGITSSYEKVGYHIQSYFYSASGSLFRAAKFGEWLDAYWRGLGASKLTPRNYAIQKGELRLTAWASRTGYKVASVFDHLHLPTADLSRQVHSLADQLLLTLGPSIESTPLASRPEGPQLLDTFRYEWLPRLGFQANPMQAWWALLLFNDFFFIKRELLDNSFVRGNCALTVHALMLPLLEAIGVQIPAWSDIHTLKEQIHASRPPSISVSSRNSRDQKI
jgi:hypothetical protein